MEITTCREKVYVVLGYRQKALGAKYFPAGAALRLTALPEAIFGVVVQWVAQVVEWPLDAASTRGIPP